jgi:hypothetical protein
LNEWNECVIEAKLDDLCTNYFTKLKKHGGEEQGIFAITIGRKGKDSGVKCGREQLVYEEALVIL